MNNGEITSKELEVNLRVVGWLNDWSINKSLQINIYQLVCQLYIDGELTIKIPIIKIM